MDELKCFKAFLNRKYLSVLFLTLTILFTGCNQNSEEKLKTVSREIDLNNLKVVQQIYKCQRFSEENSLYDLFEDYKLRAWLTDDESFLKLEILNPDKINYETFDLNFKFKVLSGDAQIIAFYTDLEGNRHIVLNGIWIEESEGAVTAVELEHSFSSIMIIVYPVQKTVVRLEFGDEN